VPNAGSGLAGTRSWGKPTHQAVTWLRTFDTPMVPLEVAPSTINTCAGARVRWRWGYRVVGVQTYSTDSGMCRNRR